MGNILPKKDIHDILKSQGSKERKYTFEELDVETIRYPERDDFVKKVAEKYNVKVKDWEKDEDCPDGIDGCEVAHYKVIGYVFYK